MLPRSDAEYAADNVMIELFDLSNSGEGWEELLDHIYQLHKLRDQRLFWELVNYNNYDVLKNLQTFLIPDPKAF